MAATGRKGGDAARCAAPAGAGYAAVPAGEEGARPGAGQDLQTFLKYVCVARMLPGPSSAVPLAVCRLRLLTELRCAGPDAMRGTCLACPDGTLSFSLVRAQRVPKALPSRSLRLAPRGGCAAVAHHGGDGAPRHAEPGRPRVPACAAAPGARRNRRGGGQGREGACAGVRRAQPEQQRRSPVRLARGARTPMPRAKAP